MSKNNILVSVIIPTYNRSKTILKTLESVKNQTYRPVEIIVVDDGSKDNTEKIVSNWIKHNLSFDLTAIYISQLNKGAPIARNMGLMSSKGRFVQFLDSDDILYPEKFTVQVNDLLANKSSISVCNFKYVSPKNKYKIIENSGNLKWRMALGWSVFTAAPLMDKNNLHIDLWDPCLRITQDIDYFLKHIIAANKITHVNQVLCEYVIHDDPQISDLYKLNKPPFLRRAFNILNYQFQIIKTSPQSYAYIYIAFLYLLKSEIRFRLVFLLKKIGFKRKHFDHSKF